MQPFKARSYPSGSADSHAVELTIDPGGMHIRGEDGSSRTIDLSNLDLTLGGFNENRLFLKDKCTGETFITQDRTMLEQIDHLPPHLKEQVHVTRTELKRAPVRQMRAFGIVIGIFAAIGVLAYLSLEGMVSYLEHTIPPSIEEKIGDVFLESYKNKDEVEPATAADSRRVERIGQHLVKALDNTKYKYRFHVQSDDEVNAFALPGGNVVVYTGLLRAAKNDSEIAGVLAHEIGHVEKRHTLKRVLRSASWFALFNIAVGGLDTNSAVVLAKAIDLEGLRYNRDQEQEADLTGIRIAYKADYNPAGLIEIFERIKEENPTSDIKALEILSDHPMPSDREETIRKEIKVIEEEENARRKNKSKANHSD